MTTKPGSTSSPSSEGTLIEDVHAAEQLLSWAVEQGKDIEKDHINTIVHSKHMLMSRELDETEEAAFWDAYRSLCIATAPVSRESLKATRGGAQKNWVGRTRYVSQANRAVRYYQAITIVAIFTLLVFQIYWVFVSTLVDDLKGMNNEIIEKRVEEYKIGRKLDALKVEEAGSENTGVTGDEQILKLKSDLDKIEMEIAQLEKRHQANLIILNKANIIGPFFLDQGTKYFITSEESLHIQTGSISIEVMSLYLLPILYGLVGACAYILRTISQQINEYTFTSASKIRLQLRMVLGALAGLSIAWFAKPEGGGFIQSLTPLALAFLAGYSVELLFSAMDTLIASFSRERSSE